MTSAEDAGQATALSDLAAGPRRTTGRCWNCPAEFVVGDGYGEPVESQVFCSESCAAQFAAEPGA
jgi:hypothetical protein